MTWIKRLLYGMLIGIASIAPGISGGTIAIAMGFYERLISSVANLLKDFKNNFKYLFPYGVGAMLSIAALSVAFDYMFSRFPLPTNMLFIGFILGTLPFIRGRFKSSLGENKISWKHIMTGLLFLIIVLLPTFIASPVDSTNSSVAAGSSGAAGASMTDAFSAANSSSIMIFFIIGVIIAATLVIPGLSGTMLLTSLGLYRPMLHTASLFVTSIVTMDITAAVDLLDSIIPLGIGVVVGGFLIAKLLNHLFRKIPSYIYAAVIGLICATPVVMLTGISLSAVTALNVIIGIAALVIGLFLGWKLGDHDD